MRIQCGKCNKLYNINGDSIPEKGASFKCKSCGNKLTVNANKTLTSASGNSKIACSNCGQLLHEDIRTCDKCDFKVNRVREDLRIDNKYYERLDMNEKGKIGPPKPKRTRKVLAFCSVGVVCMTATALGYYYYSEGVDIPGFKFHSVIEKQNKSEVVPESKTKLVILKNGNTLNAQEVKKDGLYYFVKGDNGMVMEIKVDDVLQISEVVVTR